jgi:transposase
MAYREVEMWEVLEVLRRAHRGEPQRAIQRATGRSRSTIRRYVRTARRLGWAVGQEPDEALARRVAQRLRPVGKQREAGTSEQKLAAHRVQITNWLGASESGERGLQLSKVQELLRRQGIEVPYSSLHRFAVRHCSFHDARRVTVRVADVAPGELAEVDFGRLGRVPDPETGRERIAHALIVTLVHSRHQYVAVSFSQKLADVLEGLEDAWAFFGGVPARVVIDNLAPAVTKADRYDPIFQRTFAEYAHYRGFVIDAALPQHARGKPHVERSVQYVRESFFRGEQWLDLAHVQREAVRWCRETAGLRIHGTTRQRPRVVFEEVEQSALRPLERPRFDPPQWAQCKVHPDHHISFRKALYSVPTRHVGKTVWVRADRALVRIYVEGELVKTHERQREGGRITDYRDYPKERAPYAMRDPDQICREARRQGVHVGRFAERLLADTFPWAKLRQAQRLLRLARRYGRKRVDQACRRALAFDLINVRRVEDILKHDLAREDATPTPPDPGTLLPFPSRFLRPPGSFDHSPTRKENADGDDPLTQDRAQTPEALGRPGDPARPHRLRPEDEAR